MDRELVPLKAGVAEVVGDTSRSRARRRAAEVVGDASRSRAGRRAAEVVEDASRSRGAGLTIDRAVASCLVCLQ